MSTPIKLSYKAHRDLDDWHRDFEVPPPYLPLFAHHALEHHNATLEIESAPEEGALFHMSFPLAANKSAPQLA